MVVALQVRRTRRSTRDQLNDICSASQRARPDLARSRRRQHAAVRLRIRDAHLARSRTSCTATACRPARCSRPCARRTCSSPRARSAPSPPLPARAFTATVSRRRPLQLRPSSSQDIILRAERRRHHRAPGGRRARRARRRQLRLRRRSANGKPSAAFAHPAAAAARTRCTVASAVKRARWPSCSRAFPQGVAWFIAVRQRRTFVTHLDRGSRQDAGRGDRAGVPGDADVPAELPRHDHPDAGDPGRAARHASSACGWSASRSTS